MINIFEVNETNKMIEQENLDVRTITMGISLLDCIDPDLDALNQKIYEKITTKARNLVATGDEIATEYGTSDSDPLAQRGHVGWKTMQTAVILNDAWMIRLECAATA